MTNNVFDLKARTIKFGALLNHPEFKASNAWLKNFKKRHHIVHKSIVGEARLVDNDLVDGWINSRLPDLIKGYSLDDTFNAETALFYRALPKKSLQYSGIKNDSVKVSKVRLSIIFCSNWSNNEKLEWERNQKEYGAMNKIVKRNARRDKRAFADQMAKEAEKAQGGSNTSKVF